MRSDKEIRTIAMENYSNLTNKEREHYDYSLKPSGPGFKTYRPWHRGRPASGSAEK